MPIFVLAMVAVWISWTSLQEMRQAEQTSDLIASLEAQDRAGTAFAQERALNIAVSLGIPGAQAQLEAAQEETDAAIAARDALLRTIETDALDPKVGEAVRRTINDRGSVDLLQNQVLAGTVPEAEATARYDQIIGNALEVPRALAATTADRDLAQRVEAYVALDEVLLSNTEERPYVGYVLGRIAAGEQPETEPLLRALSLISTSDTLRAEAQTALDRVPGHQVVPSFSGAFGDVRSAVLTSQFDAIDPQSARQWSTLSQEWVEKTRPVRDDVRSETAEFAAGLATSSWERLLITAGVAFGVVVLSFVLAILIARGIVTPLRRLTHATAQVRERLPQMVEQMTVPGQAPSVELVQIPVESSDEVGRLAAAFNDVNATTMEVAREQAALRGSIAEMFVNVARRDQVLLNRQLAFLDELERSEEDPSTLSNLFRLDHLATRMRRNAESLLVLAGIDSGRRVRQPMPVSDVIRTASSEIELYDRVRLDLHVDPLMLGHNALNAAHLLAELLENATMFSEPHTPVEVSTGQDERGVVVTVRDHGLGMSDQELAEANTKVASRAASDAVGAQRLGLFVVGRLADRLGATVTFAKGHGGEGTVATVVFPAVLFVPDDAVPLPQPTDPLEASTQAAVASLTQRSEPAVATADRATVPTTGLTPAAPLAPAASEPSRPEPAHQPTTAAMPIASAAAPAVEPEAPAAVPVDLDALTDGTTSAGMPRRRRSEPAPESGPIVLPPLETPELPDLGDTQVDAWTPPSEVAAPDASLPSRSRSGSVVPAEPEPEPAPTAPVLDVDQRTTLFSSFRSMDALDTSATETTLQLDAVTEDPASLPDELESQEQPAATVVPVPDEPAEPEESAQAAELAEPAEAAWAPAEAAPAAEAAQPESAWAPRPADPTEPESAWAPRPTDPAPAWEPRPAEPVAEQAPEPVSEQAAAQTDEQASAAPAEGSTFQSLPAFEELMSDLPTRRAVREAANAGRKRGLFGRRPATDAAAGSASASTAGSAASPAAPEQPAAGPLVPPPAAAASPAHQVLAPPASPVTPAAPPAPVPPRTSVTGLRPSAPEPVAYQPRAFEPAPSPVAPQAAPAAEAAPQAPSSYTPRPAQDEAPPRTTTSYGESVLPLRSTSGAVDPLDPHHVPDTVEARSEWMASAVLYEEMSSLLRRGVFQEETVTAQNDEQTYRPTVVAEAGNGLTRRHRGDEPATPAERFTARIERDPEQLRARLSAFQSATLRGRSEASASETVSTGTGSTVNDVPGSAPQSR
ncbi:nitrate- and nitrite sensing domain-containing protein [Isoptericola variabilis]|uniref:nitrate- and nitrite sensing domain-containing protein n=1 Tax=Isoptericola variabilis TaxID=139208 RepID=UPI0002FF15A3|nr:nitrate- and nitrite sensing domain-containing protein [Isoptericola variabilis]